jgi:hypothetical protein
MLSSSMLLLNLILLIDVTFSTPTGVLISLRRLFAFIWGQNAQWGFFTNWEILLIG